MGFCNSPPYVQRQMDKMLREFRVFCRTYIDDIVIFSASLEEHVRHLSCVFQKFSDMNVSINPKKSFVGYPSVTLLGQKVDGLGLATDKDKIKALLDIQFPTNLKDLEIYLGLTNWLRKHIPYYAQASSALQARKTALLKGSPRDGNARRAYVSRTYIKDPTEAEFESYKTIQSNFVEPSFLFHLDPKRPVYADVDSSVAYGHGAIIYQVENDPDISTIMKDGKAGLFLRSSIQPILFLSKLLSSAETRYWPTELEVAGLVWLIKKARHLLEGGTREKATTIFTDHSAATFIAKQTDLNSSSVEKLNLRLIRASQYLSQFNLQVVYRPGKIHLVPDALSRLLGAMEESHTNTLDDLTIEDADTEAFTAVLVEMAPEFRQKIIKSYTKEPQWNRILRSITEEPKSAKTSSSRTSAKKLVGFPDLISRGKIDGIRFIYENGLIFYLAKDDKKRLCIPRALHGDVFRLAHDENNHAGFHRSYEAIADTLYLKRLSDSLKTYIAHCPECQKNQTKRHKPYGSLRPIISPPLPYHTIAMDFIVELPVTSYQSGAYDTCLTITCKFSKKVILKEGQATWDAAKWGVVLLTALIAYDWGIPRAILSDRDPKFMSILWKAIFKKLDTKMLTSTAYHPQTDGQSERTNQVVEIALRYFLTSHPTKEWNSVLPFLQGGMNNSVNVSSGLSPNEVTIGFRVANPLGLLTEMPPADYAKLRGIKRDEAEESIAFANASAKARYDSKHKPLSFEVNDEAYLRLHKGYTIPGLSNRKLGPQREGPFRIKRKVGSLAYELDLPPIIEIHPVISIAQLEPAPKSEDPFKRPYPTNPGPVRAEGDDSAPSYEIERIIGKRISRKKLQYLVSWKGYNSAHNVWYNVENLDNAKEAIEDYETWLKARPPPRRQNKQSRRLLAAGKI